LNNILAKRSHKKLFATASYILLDIENRKLKTCYAGHHGLMISRHRNLLESGKAGETPLGIIENSNYIEEVFLLLPRLLEFLYSDRTVGPVNQQFKLEGT
jgi:serine phosphatase RsbU (regulator of sigma subunit)